MTTEQQKILLELIYAVRALASNVETMHGDLRAIVEDKSNRLDREIDRIKELAQKNTQLLTVLPINTADRLDRLIDKKVDGVLEDVRISLNEVRDKLYTYVRTKDLAVPEKAIEEKDDVTGRIQIDEKGIHLSMKTEKLEAAWKVLRWVVAAVAAGGGVVAVIKSLLAH
jgi:hypothetical protein